MIRVAINIYVLALGIVTAISLLGQACWPLNLFIHFSPHLAIAASILAFVCFAHKSRHLVVACLFLVGVNAYFPFLSLFDKWSQPTATTGQSPITLEVLTANISYLNLSIDQVVKQLRALDADIVAIQENNIYWRKNLAQLSDLYPNVVFGVDNRHRELVILSKFPIIEVERVIKNEIWLGILSALIELPSQKKIRVITTHIPDPSSLQRANFQKKTIEELRNLLIEERGSLILAGDLNATPWSPIFQRLHRGTKVVHGTKGELWTWPNLDLPIGIPIDHIFTKGSVGVIDSSTGPLAGSDHRYLLAKIWVIS